QAEIANMSRKSEESRLLVHHAAQMLASGKEKYVIAYASMAKCFSSDSAMDVTTDAVQLLGGYGYVKEYPLERMMRDAKITQIYEGTNQIQRVIIANQIINN